MKVGELCERFEMVGHYAGDKKFLQEYWETDVLAYVAAMPKERDAWNSGIVAFIFRSARQLNGFVNGHKVSVQTAVNVITSTEIECEITDEGKKAMLMEVL